MRRVVVVGGRGLFGRTIVEHLRALGVDAIIASRHGEVAIRVDANDPVTIRRAFGAQDLVIDAAGPFQSRSMALVEAAIESGFDVIDLNDSLDYAQRVLELEPRIADAGIRVLSSASSVSAVTAAMVHDCGCEAPVRVTAFLAPATRYTANRSTALTLIHSIGAPIRVYRDGVLITVPGWSEMRSFRMPDPLGKIHGGLFESADAIYLPRIWPSLRDVAMYVDPNVPGARAVLRWAASSPTVRRFLASQVQLGTWLARVAGSTAGGLGYEIEDANGKIMTCTLTARHNSFHIAVAPALLAAQAILADRFPQKGLIPPDQHVTPQVLLAHLHRVGMEVTSSWC